MNLLFETQQAIKASGYTVEDIIFIGSEHSGYQCSWDEFIKLADVEYDNGFGAQEVASDLVIVFRDGQQLVRHEYDGSEGWAYSRPFVRPIVSKPIRRLTVDGTNKIGWKTLEDLNAE